MKIRNLLMLAVASVVLLAGSGCAYLKSYQASAEERVLLYLRENGTVKTDKYIDKLVTEGKLTQYQADKLKEIIHSAIEKVKEILEEKVEDSAEPETSAEQPTEEEIPFCSEKK